MKEEVLPKAAVLQAALRATTDRLAAELASPTDNAPDWNDFEWHAAMAVAVMHGISGLLAGKLRWQGPQDWQSFLAEQAEQGRDRELRIHLLLDELDWRAKAAGLPLLAMKGSALLRLELYAPGERPMSDVDLLVDPAHIDAADRLILAAGYARGVCQPRHIAYEPKGQSTDRAFGEHAGNPVKIELHVAVQEPLPQHAIDITAQLLRADAASGLATYPSLATLMRHLLLHTAGNLCNCCVRLIQLHDIAALAARLDAADWNEVLAHASDGRPAWWAVPPLRLAQRLFPGRLPQTAALERAIAACPRGLRNKHHQLVNVSLSRLAIPMLPGVEWSRDVTEALALARERLHPAREAQVINEQVVRTQHALAGATWSYRPRWLKALSFLLGSPPRVQTLYSLHRALAYRPSSSA